MFDIGSEQCSVVAVPFPADTSEMCELQLFELLDLRWYKRVLRGRLGHIPQR
jgi:hypothetical protein